MKAKLTSPIKAGKPLQFMNMCGNVLYLVNMDQLDVKALVASLKMANK